MVEAETTSQHSANFGQKPWWEGTGRGFKVIGPERRGQRPGLQSQALCTQAAQGSALATRTPEEVPGVRGPASYGRAAPQWCWAVGDPSTAEESTGRMQWAVSLEAGRWGCCWCPWKGLQRRGCPVAGLTELDPSTHSHFLSP